MDGGGIGKLHMAHFLHGVLHDPRGRKLDRYAHTVPLIMAKTADKSNIAIGRLNTVLVLHHLITYPKIEAAHLQIGFLRLRVHQLSDRLVELVNGGRAGGAEGR